MDRARFVEENGTLENQMGAAVSGGENERGDYHVTPPLIHGTVIRTGIYRSKKSGFPLTYGSPEIE